jgi:hypothetical protein
MVGLKEIGGWIVQTKTASRLPFYHAPRGGAASSRGPLIGGVDPTRRSKARPAA